jgi:dTDP-6-deoxy-L-talose 4-dehydrogenase (NAD+)
MKVLITGASGFLGLPITENLVDLGGYEIYAVTTGRKPVSFSEGVSVLSADLLDRAQSESVIKQAKPDIMVHLAWDLSDSSFLHSHKNLVWLEESLFMLRVFAENGGKYFAFAGSSDEYGCFTGFSDSGYVKKPSLYGTCKNDFHRIAKEFCEAQKISYVNLRFFPTIGKRMRANTALITAARAFSRGEKFICKAPYNIWDFISVNDAAKAAVAVIAKKHEGAIDIASGVPRLMGDVFKRLAEKMGTQHLLDIDSKNTEKAILVADTTVLNEVIGYKCNDKFDEILNEVIAQQGESPPVH